MTSELSEWKNDIILFIVAHPDDESMFFFPTIQSLRKVCKHENLYLLCLSTGNYDGLGSTRTKELYEAGDILGFMKKNIEILDDPRLQDGPEEKWNASDLSSLINRHIEEIYITRKDFKRVTTIRLITFDKYGVSMHSNHIDTCKGVLYLSKAETVKNLKAFELRTVGIVRKYLILIDLILILVSKLWRLVSIKRKSRRNSRMNQIACKEFHPIRCWNAMAAHNSQFVWYRKLFILFSRYTYFNDLQEINISKYS